MSLIAILLFILIFVQVRVASDLSSIRDKLHRLELMAIKAGYSIDR